MKIAIPTANGKLCQHFGHCEKFVFIEVDEVTKTIIKTSFVKKYNIKVLKHNPIKTPSTQMLFLII